MPMEFTTWEARDEASAGADLGFAALAFCRAARGTPGIKGSTYWVQGVGRLAVLVETEPGVALADWMASPEVAKATLAFGAVARNIDNQTWQDPASGAAVIAAAAG